MLPLCLIVSDRAPHAAAVADPALECQRDLESLGIRPYRVHDLPGALEVVGQWRFDAVLIDASGRPAAWMPSLAMLRERARAPIVLLSPDGDEAWQIAALRGGATEVIVTPASPRLVAAKLHRLLDVARAGAEAANDEERNVVLLGPLRLDPRRAMASFGLEPFALTAGEFELLLLLASRAGEFVHRDVISRALGVSGGARRSADMHVCRIRKKLRQVDPAEVLAIDTVWGRGYCLRLSESPPEQDQGSGTSRPGFALEQPRKARPPGAAGRLPPPL